MHDTYVALCDGVRAGRKEVRLGEGGWGGGGCLSDKVLLLLFFLRSAYGVMWIGI